MMSSSVKVRKNQFGKTKYQVGHSRSFFVIPPVAFSVADWFTQNADEPFDWHYPCTPTLGGLDRAISNHGDHDGDHQEQHESDVATATPAFARPPFYVVVLFNDDYTPMEFVILVLQQYFDLDLDRATGVMLSVHYEGKGVAGMYPRDIAETKAQLVNRYARAEGHPLLCQIEPQSV